MPQASTLTRSTTSVPSVLELALHDYYGSAANHPASRSFELDTTPIKTAADHPTPRDIDDGTAYHLPSRSEALPPTDNTVHTSAPRNVIMHRAVSSSVPYLPRSTEPDLPILIIHPLTLIGIVDTRVYRVSAAIRWSKAKLALLRENINRRIVVRRTIDHTEQLIGTLQRYTDTFAIIVVDDEEEARLTITDDQRVEKQRRVHDRYEHSAHATTRKRTGTSNASVRVTYAGFPMDSILEAKYAVLMDQLNINWVSQPTSHARVTNSRLYTPDFYLPDLDVVLEIKGRAPCSVELEKCRTLSAQYPHTKVVLFYGGFANPYVMKNMYARRGTPRISSYVYLNGELTAFRAAWSCVCDPVRGMVSSIFFGDLAGKHYTLCSEAVVNAFDTANRMEFVRL